MTLPLVRFTARRTLMGEAVNPLWLSAACIVVAAVLVGLNLKLVADFVL